MSGANFYILLALTFCISCDNPEQKIKNNSESNDIVIKSELITSSYLGNGAQWGGYDILESWTGSPTLTESDWNKLFGRVSFMHPSIVRIMISKGWNYFKDNKYDPSKSEPVLLKILDFCQQNGITVILGEWGHNGGSDIDEEWLEQSADFLQWLIITKGYSCIRYFNMVNEPNGSWSTIGGNYSLWERLIKSYYAKLSEKGLNSNIKLLGPDIAVWNTNLISWLYNVKSDMSTNIKAYDIHTYPAETEVRSGSYYDMVKTYRNTVPDSCVMLMTELGFKYKALSELGIENSARISADKYASDDSNMFIYDAFYGIDMADVIIQNMLAGYAGVIVWDMDDAMYNKDATGSTKLKRWGFWNILGSEKFDDPSDENIRPWFYTVSLMCRYFPKGTKIHSVSLPDKNGLRAIAGELDGKYTIAIVNSGSVNCNINLKMEEGLNLSGLSIYSYQAGTKSSFKGNLNENGFAKPDSTGVTYKFANGSAKRIEVPAQSFCLITNMNAI